MVIAVPLYCSVNNVAQDYLKHRTDTREILYLFLALLLVFGANIKSL